MIIIRYHSVPQMAPSLSGHLAHFLKNLWLQGTILVAPTLIRSFFLAQISSVSAYKYMCIYIYISVLWWLSNRPPSILLSQHRHLSAFEPCVLYTPQENRAVLWNFTTTILFLSPWLINNKLLNWDLILGFYKVFHIFTKAYNLSNNDKKI